MRQGRSWCVAAFQKRIGIIALIILVVGMCWIAKSAKGIWWAQQATSRSVAYAETLTGHTQVFRLVPDNTSALAAQHFQRAETALGTTDLARAQAELEKAISYAEMELSRPSGTFA